MAENIQGSSNINGVIRGLVFGKFTPLHNGHIALIRFAATQCDEVIVSMSYKEDDPINGVLRFSWIQETFKNDPSIRPEVVEDNFDDESLPLAERTKLWAAFIKQRYPAFDLIFSSEEYGDPFAANLGAKHITFDPSRQQIPVSATLIRKQSLLYWDYIPLAVRPYFVKKICFYGPESTGKSSLAKYFAAKYNTEFVPEVARELITSNDFSLDDIIRIGEAQTDRVIQKSKTANKFLFCDTDVITTEIYSQHYLHEIPPILFELENKIKYDLYFLLDTDIEWIADGLRDLGDRRDEMYEVFKAALDQRDISYVKVKGTWEERIRIIEEKLSLL